MEGLMAINKRHEMGAQVRNAMLKKKSDIVVSVIFENFNNSNQSHIRSIVIQRNIEITLPLD